MKILELNNKNFNDTVFKSDKNVLVSFYSQWCPPCKMLSSVLEKFASTTDKDITIAKVNVDNELELAKTYNIYSVPTLILVNNGEIIKTEAGFKTKEALERFIEK